MQADEDWITNHGGMIARIAASYERRPALQEELAQEILLAVWRAKSTFRGEASERTFIARIAHNVSISHVRRAVRHRAGELADEVPDSSPGPEIQADLALKRARLEHAVQRLPLPMMQVMTLFLEGFSAAEIAAALSISQANAEVRISRAKSALKTRMEGHRDGPE